MKTMQSIVASVSSGGEPFHKPPMASREGCTVAGARAALDAAGFFFSANVNIFSLDDEELKQVFGRTLNTKIREWGKRVWKVEPIYSPRFNLVWVLAYQ